MDFICLEHKPLQDKKCFIMPLCGISDYQEKVGPPTMFYEYNVFSTHSSNVNIAVFLLSGSFSWKISATHK
jgi:hypothetical protein